MTDRSFYLNDFADETMPCDATEEGWAAWLSQPDTEWGRDEAARDGETFDATATVWKDDIIARRVDGAWTLSHDPDDDDFMAVRFGPGLGWSSDNIPTPEFRLNSATGEYEWEQSAAKTLLAWFAENDVHCDDVEHVAIGTHETGWRAIYHAGPPPSITLERVQ